MNGQTKNNFGFSPAGSRPSSSTSQNCFSGSSVYAGPSDISSVACPENHIYNPIAIGHATGLAPPLCISGMEPSPQYPALVSAYTSSTVRKKHAKWQNIEEKLDIK